MSANQTVLCRSLSLEKQHRCSYTGGKAVHSRQNNEWIACLNNGEVTFLSTRTGEIMMNVTAVGECVQTLSPLSKTIKNAQEMDSVTTFAVSADDSLLALATRHSFIRVLSLVRGDLGGELIDVGLVSEFKSDDDGRSKAAVRALLFYASGSQVVGGRGDGSVMCWSSKSGRVLRRFASGAAHFLPLTVLALNPMARHRHDLVTGAQDTKLRCLDLRAKGTASKPRELPSAHRSTILDVAFVGAKALMLSVASADCVCVWDAATYALLSVVDNHTHQLTRILPLPSDENVVLLGDEQGAVHWYHIHNKTKGDGVISTLREVKRRQTRVCDSAITALSAVNSDKLKGVLAVTEDCNFHFLRFSESKLIEERVLVGYNDEILDAELLDADGRRAVLACNSSCVKILQLDSLCFSLLRGHSATVMSVAVDKSTQIIASASKDRCVRFWRGADGACLAVGKGHKQSVNCVVNVSECTFISGSADGEVKVWRLSASGSALACTHTLCEDGKEVMQLAAHANFVAFCGANRFTLCSLDAARGELSYIKSWWAKHGRGVHCVRFSRHDALLATGHSDGEIRVWRVPALQCAKVLQSAHGAVLDVAFVNLSTQLLTSSATGVVQAWSLREAQCVAEYTRHYDKVWRILPISHGKYLSVGCDSIINVWADHTAQMERDALAEKHAVEMSKTRIDNCIRNGDFKGAIKGCLRMDEPQKLFALLLARYNDIGDMDDIVASLDCDELATLMTLLIDFNTGSTKYCFIAQSLLHLMYTHFELGDLLKLQLKRTHVAEKQQVIDLNVPEIMLSDRKQNFAQLNSALMAYSNRHLKRVDNLLLNLSVLDFVTQ